MNYRFLAAVILGVNIFVGAQSLNLTGRVIDSVTRAGIPGASVLVAGAKTTTLTDANGDWSIITTGIQHPEGAVRIISGSYIVGNSFHFNIPGNGSAVQITILDMQGRQVRTLVNKPLHGGSWTVSGLNHGLKPQFYLLRVRVGSSTFSHKLLVTNTGARSAELRRSEENTRIVRAKVAALADSLVVNKGGYNTAIKAITSYSGNHIITLTQGQRPNIVFILIDDMAWNGTPVLMDTTNPGSASKFLVMPTVEKLASRSMIFQNAYSSPLCSPSRCQIQTAKSAPRTSMTMVDGTGPWPIPDTVIKYEKPLDSTHRVLGPIHVMDIQASWPTIGEKMKELGYTTALFGKWHIGGGGPAEHGFDYSNGNTNNSPGGDTLDRNDPKHMFSITDSTVKFMDREAKAKRPFYVQLSHYANHRNFFCKPDTWEKYKKNPLFDPLDNKKYNMLNTDRGLAAMCENLDSSISIVLKKIDDLGIAGNTYIVFTSDNGYRNWNEGLWPLRGHKWYLWDGGLRVPLLISGPGIIPKTRSTKIVSNLDYLPTFMDLAGGDPSTLKDIDGKNIVPLLKGGTVPAELETRTLYFHIPHYRTTGAPASAMITGDEKVLYFYDAPRDSNYKINTPYYFNIKKDVLETNDLAGANPTRANQLNKMLMDYLAEVKARMPIPNPIYKP